MTNLKQNVLILIMLMWTMVSAIGQDYTTAQNAASKTKDAYKKAYAYITQKDFANAIKDLEKLIKKDPKFINAPIELANAYEYQTNYEKAIHYFNQALKLSPDYEPRIYFALARIAAKQENYAEAEKQLTKFLTYEKIHPNLLALATKRLGDAQFIPKALANPVPFELKNLGNNINSANREYFPSITLDNELVFTVLLGAGQQGQEDLYSSKMIEDVWQKSIPIPTVNTPENEGAQSISADGKLLVFTVCNRREDYGSCDLYFSKKVNGKWTAPQNIGTPINSREWESQPSIAPNGDAIYFVRGGARGEGHKDLFVSRLQADGKWGEPENITELNTPFNESSPSIHPDGQTLYFSSDGHPGMGGFDLFVSRKKIDGTWGEPMNLGYPINTAKQEEALAVNRKGTVAYLASDREGGFGLLDLYSFELPENARPAPVTYINGITLDLETNLPLAAEVEILDIKTKKTFYKLNTSKDGTFVVCLPIGEYALTAKREGYLFFSANYDLNEPKSLELAYLLEAKLQPLVYKDDDSTKKVVRRPIVLENVFFATNSTVLKTESTIELDKLKRLLDENPKMVIELTGHTDNVGQPEDNLKLSDGRANAVRNYLISNGIAASRMTAKGLGETMPRHENDTPEGRAKNRRTEFQVLF